ncbi:MAG: PfkB family carbohydrate kinase, partial [Nocardioides sp.]|nr:PfkB family carbohydrate kinase [Nocardioides sp.]
MESDERGPQQVLVVGGINADVTVSSERRARPGETVVGDGPIWSPGGKGANIAAAAARAGANVTMCGAVGDDPLGQVQVNALLEAGVGVDAIRVSAGQATGVALIVVTPDGENSITVGAGANLTVGPEDLAAAGEYDVMLVQSEIGAATADAAVAVAASTHSRVVLSLAPVSELEPITWQRADPLVVNRDEAGDVLALFGRTAPDDPEVLTVAVREVSGVASVVISLGAEGCVVGSHEGTVHVPAVPTKVVD